MANLRLATGRKVAQQQRHQVRTVLAHFGLGRKGGEQSEKQ